MICDVMSIKSSTFGGVRLSGEDAEKFRKQVAHGRPKKAAKESAKRGESLLREFNENGYVRLARRG